MPPAVKNLTHANLLALWGVDNDQAALEKYNNAHQGGLLAPTSLVGELVGSVLAPLKLEVSDISTIQSVFTPDRVQHLTGGASGAVQPAFSLSCCCCSPCCCCCMAAMDPDSATASL